MKFKEYIAEDYRVNERYNKRYCLNRFLTREHEDIIWKYQLLLRKEEYWDIKGNKFLSFIYRRRKNKLGERIGFTIPKGVFGPGLKIWHYGNIVVNPYAKVGAYCVLHGDNCIGNQGLGRSECPILGDNVDIGVGAKIIGNVTIADNTWIGANAVVTKSFLETETTIVGIPAKIIRDRKIVNHRK